MKKIAIATLILVLPLICGCSNPKSTVIPQDSKNWSSMSDQIKQLDADDKRLLTAYLTRMAFAGVFTHNAVIISPGTTIGDAIDQERSFESKTKGEADSADEVRQKAQAAAAVEVEKLNRLITFAALSISILPKDINVERFSPELSVPFAVKNNTAKEISGVKGVIEIQDVFGTTLKKLNIAADKSIPPGAQVTMADYVWRLNDFDNDDQHLMSIDLSKARARFTPSMIVFADGTKEVAPDAD